MNFENMTMQEVDEAVRKEQNKIWEQYSEYKQANPLLPPDAVVDEEKSVRWNREQVKALNKERNAKATALKRKYEECNGLFEAEAKRRIKEEYGLSEKAVNIVYGNAYERGHSAGFLEVWWNALEFAEFAKSILDAEKENS